MFKRLIHFLFCPDVWLILLYKILLFLISEMDLSKDTTFVQEFLDKPFLIDKRKFDIAVFTVITSVRPLRIYTIDHILNIR